MKVLETIVVLFLLLALTLSALTGLLMNYLFVFLPISVCHKLVARLIALVRKKLYFGLWTGLLRSQSRIYLFQAGLRNALWIIMGSCVHIAVIPIQFSSTEWTGILWVLWGSVAVLCILEWFPHRRIAVVPNVFYGLVLCFLIFQLCKIHLPVNSKKAIILSPPFHGEWYAFHAGNSVLINQHYYAGSQRYALDLFLAEDGRLPLQGERDLHAYQTFGQTLLAPVDGVVAALENDAEDQEIGSSDIEKPVGNHVTIRTDAGVYVLVAHFQKGSVSVDRGDRVQTGQQIARCGNSGNTSQPHVHIQAMTQEDLFSSESKPVPILFEWPGRHVPRSYKRKDSVKGQSLIP